jgi:hypothetical protein
MLVRDGNLYKFGYLGEGFKTLVAFPDRGKIYVSDKLFPSFSSRIPDRRRSDIGHILNNYNLDGYDEFELLKRSGGRLPTDSIEFVGIADLSVRIK